MHPRSLPNIQGRSVRRHSSTARCHGRTRTARAVYMRFQRPNLFLGEPKVERSGLGQVVWLRGADNGCRDDGSPAGDHGAA
jgi:hypothetical protein